VRACSNRLYAEFERYYVGARCRWAPANPRRLFNLAFKRVYPAYREKMSRWQFLAAIYRTLGVRDNEELPGLFQTFDPRKYKGPLPLEDHFVNFFKKKLVGNLTLAMKRVTDNGRRGDREKFIARPEIGLLTEQTRFSRHDIEAVEALPEALAHLESEERVVIQLTYWAGDSNRSIGRCLGLNHKTVAARHRSAMSKLRRCYNVAG